MGNEGIDMSQFPTYIAVLYDFGYTVSDFTEGMGVPEVG